MRKLRAVAFCFFGLTGAAAAAPINYQFTVNVAEGPQIGTYHGTFSIDSATAAPGSFHTKPVLTEVNFTFAGTTYTAATFNTGFVMFDFAGNLWFLGMGNNCAYGSCVIQAGSNHFRIGGSIGSGFSFAYTSPTWPERFTGSVFITRIADPVIAAPVPELTEIVSADAPVDVSEPATWALLGAGLLGLAAMRRRKTA